MFNSLWMTLIMLSIWGPVALAGGGSHGGGDEYAIDFARVAELEIYPWLKESGSYLNPSGGMPSPSALRLSPGKFFQSLMSMKVVSL